MTSVRQAAAEALLGVERGRSTLAAEVDRARGAFDDPRDRALLLDLAAGTLRWRNALDAVIEPASRRTMDALDPAVRAVLRLGAYQLRHLTRVPAHAIVHEAVDTARALGVPRAAGFINAVLRRIAERPDEGGLPERPADGASREAQLRHLTTTLSHPEWLAARWLDREGFDASATWCDFNNRPPEPTVRWRRPSDASLLDALAAAGIDARPARYVRHAARLAPGTLGRLPKELRAAVSVQDEGSQLVAYAVAARPGDRVLDVCAAPGGKSVVIAGALGDRGLLVAGDHRPARLKLLRQTLEAVGPGAVLLGLDARRSLPFSPVFDRVLLDAPCSGLGTLARDPDVKWRRSEADLPGFAASQRTMLAQAAQVVRPGGLLIYATCSAEPDENDEVVDAFLAEHPDFSNMPVVFPTEVDGADELLTTRGRLATSPSRHGLDAFFAAVLARRPAP